MAGNNQEEGDWKEYRRLVLNELERIAKTITDVEKRIEDFRQQDIQKIRMDIAMLQVKSGMWGALSGLIVTLSIIMLKFIK